MCMKYFFMVSMLDLLQSNLKTIDPHFSFYHPLLKPKCYYRLACLYVNCYHELLFMVFCICAPLYLYVVLENAELLYHITSRRVMYMYLFYRCPFALPSLSGMFTL